MLPRSPLLRLLEAAAILASTASAQTIIESLSFGHHTPISSNGQQIDGWKIAHEGPAPPVLSDRIILTPPAPGLIRAGLWTEGALLTDSFELDLGFRVSGQERGSGNLQLWFVRDPAPASGLKSVYTADRFEGLVITVDQYSGGGGAVRAFLNDGSIDFKSHHNIDTLAFGHCAYSYRNLGRWSSLRVRHDASGFEVLIDDKTCFRSNIVAFPSDYHFGLSAASADTPDSFEVNRFVVRSASSHAPPPSAQRGAAPPPPPNANAYQQQQQPIGSSAGGDIAAQLATLERKLQSTYAELAALGDLALRRHDELRNSIGAIPAVPQAQIATMDRRLQSIETTVQRIQQDIEGRDYKETLSGLQRALKDTQNDLMSSLPQSMSQIVSTSAPKMWLFIGILLAFQVALAGCYVLYKRRIANSPKKLL